MYKRQCQDSASTRPAISSPPASTASTGRPTRRRMRRRSTLRAAANSAPAPAQAKPTTRHAAAVSHESAGSATFGMTSPMPMGLAMANATNEARSIVAAWRTTGPLNRMSSSTNTVDPIGAKKSALNAAAIPQAAA